MLYYYDGRIERWEKVKKQGKRKRSLALDSDWGFLPDKSKKFLEQLIFVVKVADVETILLNIEIFSEEH